MSYPSWRSSYDATDRFQWQNAPSFYGGNNQIPPLCTVRALAFDLVLYLMTQATSRTQMTKTTTHQQQRQQQQEQHQQALGGSSLSTRQQLNLSGSQQQLYYSAGDDDKVVLTGLGLQTARVNEHAEFIIDGSSAGPGQFANFDSDVFTYLYYFFTQILYCLFKSYVYHVAADKLVNFGRRCITDIRYAFTYLNETYHLYSLPCPDDMVTFGRSWVQRSRMQTAFSGGGIPSDG